MTDALAARLTERFGLWGDCKRPCQEEERWAEVAAFFREQRIPCTTCGGVPPASGRTCVCDGRNTIYAEIDGLREVIFQLNTRRAQLPTREEIIQIIKRAMILNEGEWGIADALLSSLAARQSK